MANFIFRCDVSPDVGMGHISRCTTLALALKKTNNNISFVCRVKDFDVVSALKNVTTDIHIIDWDTSIERDIDYLCSIGNGVKRPKFIIDHYRVDEMYQQKLLFNNFQWLQFDYQAKDDIYANWIHNANPVVDENSYKSLAKAASPQFMLGPNYALLRDEFIRCRDMYNFSDKVTRILISLGGGDGKGMIKFCLDALKKINRNIERLVLVSKTSPNIGRMKKWLDEYSYDNVRILVDTKNMAKLMAESDIAIIAGGVTTFETAAMGLPSIIIQLASNQKNNIMAWEKLQVTINAGHFQTISADNLYEIVYNLIKNNALRKNMADKGRSIVDGNGAKRVAQLLVQ